MSGGHWGYQGNEFEALARRTAELWRLMEVIEHELDWGISCDTCRACAESRVAPSIEAFFDTHCDDATAAIAIMRDALQHECSRCAGRSR